MPPSFPQDPFSQRFGARPVKAHKFDELPTSAKGNLVILIDELRGKYLSGAYSLGPKLSDVVGRTSEGPGDMHQIRQLIQVRQHRHL